MKIKNISIQNYKSIKSLSNFEMEKKINILIGSNGVGKSNFISFLILLKQIANKNLQGYAAEKAGANKLLYFGIPASLTGRIEFDNGNAYGIELESDSEDAFYFSKETTASKTNADWHNIEFNSKGYKESKLDEMIQSHKKEFNYGGIPENVKKALSNFEVYHFYDTGIHSSMKKICDINDNRFLRKEGSNIAAFLLYLKEKQPFVLKKIEGVIRQIAPFFDTFLLEPLLLNPEKIKLEWREKGSDEYFNADQLSDGTLRMIALATLLLQPSPPETIIIDEPELGLHPAAIQQLAGLIRKASIQSQIIISTQSVTLVNQFNPEDLIIVERLDESSTFKKLKQQEIEAWLDNYSLGEAWEKNIIGGRP